MGNVLSKFMESNKLSTGTTIVGLCCKDGVILGADTRSTSGNVVMDKNKLKVRRISSRIMACGAGTSAICDYLTKLVRARLDVERQTVQEFSDDSLQLDLVPVAVQYLSSEIARFSSEESVSVFIVGGVDIDGPKLYEINSDAVPRRLSYCSLGSGSPNAIAALEEKLEQLSLNITPTVVEVDVQSGLDIVRRAVKAGILNDLGSGSHIDLCVIRKNSTEFWREHDAGSVSTQLLEESEENGASRTTPNNTIPEDFLGRRVWSRLSSRLVFEDNKLYEEAIPHYDETQELTVEQISDM